MSKHGMAAGAMAAVVLAAGMMVSGTAEAAAACTFYVSASGSDGNAGTSPDRPWATLERARDHIRQYELNKDMRADIRVCLRGGRHTRTATFDLAEADSGSNGFKVVYQAYPGETRIIDGGKAVTGWKRVTDQPYFVADVPESACYADYFRQLYVGGRRAQPAMGKGIVGSGFFDEASIPNPPANPERPTRSYDGVQFPAARVPAYTNVRDIRLLHIAIGFKIDYFPVVDISASGTDKRVRLAQPHFQSRLNRDDGFSLDYDDTFYVLNAFEELDSPGEWYLNRATNKVYYYPRAGEDVNQAGAYVPVVETLVNVAGSSPSEKASAIAFDGITFEHGNWLLPRDRFIGGSQAEAQYADDPFKDPNYDGYGGEVPGQVTADQDPCECLATLHELEDEDVRYGVYSAFDGASELLHGLPPGTWALVTSNYEHRVRGRFLRTGLPMPDVIVDAAAVEEGKPSPVPYLRAAARLGAEPGDCLVIEDAPSGVRSGLRAGMTVWGVNAAVAVEGVHRHFASLHEAVPHILAFIFGPHGNAEPEAVRRHQASLG